MQQLLDIKTISTLPAITCGRCGTHYPHGAPNEFWTCTANNTKSCNNAMWNPDTKACEVCAAKFTLLFRPHHCRACGKCVCSTCSKKTAYIAPWHVHKGSSRPHRVCNVCESAALTEAQKLGQAIGSMFGATVACAAVVPTLAVGFASGMEGVANGLVGAVDGVANGFKNAVDGAANGFKNAADECGRMVRNFILVMFASSFLVLLIMARAAQNEASAQQVESSAATTVTAPTAAETATAVESVEQFSLARFVFLLVIGLIGVFVALILIALLIEFFEARKKHQQQQQQQQQISLVAEFLPTPQPEQPQQPLSSNNTAPPQSPPPTTQPTSSPPPASAAAPPNNTNSVVPISRRIPTVDELLATSAPAAAAAASSSQQQSQQQGLATLLRGSAALRSRLPLIDKIIDGALSVANNAFAAQKSDPHRFQTIQPLNEDECLALALYTFEIGTGNRDDNFYYLVNCQFRQQNAQLVAALAPFLHNFNAAFAKLPQQHGPVFRGIAVCAADQLRIKQQYATIGRQVVWNSITSVSSDERVAATFEQGTSACGVSFRITASDVRSISAFSAIPAEDEFVMAPGSTLFVNQPPPGFVQSNPNGCTIFLLQASASQERVVF